jgi:two-component system, NtrC family, sensor kinase
MNCGMGQDSTVFISRSLLKDTADINIGRMNGWIFKSGHQPGWQKKKPIELSENDADINGRVEGWFRIKIKTEQSVNNIAIGFKYNGWGAAEVYLDEKQLASYGSAGHDSQSFHEYNPMHRRAIPISLIPGRDHLIAIHFVDYVPNFPLPKRLRSLAFLALNPYTFSNSLFSITAPEYNSELEMKEYQHMIFKTSVFGIILIITILFWLVSYQNPNEISLRLISIFSTLGVILAFERVFWHSQSTSYQLIITTLHLSPILSNTEIVLVPMIIAESLRQQIAPSVKKLLISMSIIVTTLTIIYYNTSYPLVNIIFNLSSLVISGLVIYRSRKTLKGAEWSIVIGFICEAVSILVPNFFRTPPSFPLRMTLDSITFLSIPGAYIVYISVRFREIIKEVQDNAKQIVLISEEKKALIAIQNEMLENQVAERTSELHQSLQDLKAAQKQLIQSEKMASLGELTAGIAHEIQNPLNFVNNFSEVNNELITEMREEIAKKNFDEVDQIAKDVQENEQKINHHGKRADAIVKGMLQHSQLSKGVKEPTDINALADEYLRLSYHGLRAKNKDFNAEINTNFDNTIGKINLIQQDIGKVLLNLYNNAFYAASEKKRAAGAGYGPTILVSTNKIDHKVTISVKDNGNGIPQKVVDKIFQPFFTTKPTGQGTGLGLSLSYDIVKAHGGEIKVETKEGEFTEFIIQLPA